MRKSLDTYDTAGRLASRALANGVSTGYTYDLMNRIISIVVTGPGGAVLDERHYGYNAAGNRAWTVQGALTPQSGSPIGEVYQYDATDQVTGVKYGAANPNLGYAQATAPAKTETFGYDAAGNRATSATNNTTVSCKRHFQHRWS